jgi:serine/threonine protein kinase
VAGLGSFSPPAGFRDSTKPALSPGEVIASTYRVGAEIARTDDGVVFDARDMLLDRPVALKLAWRDPGTPSLIAEARRCAAVRDPCAVQVHGMGTHNGVEFAVAERVEGHLLKAELGQPLPPDRYLARLRTLVAAVARAHDGGIAVGDISGSTVLASSDQRLVLGRLSLSQVPAFGPHGQILAPEVVRGEVEGSDPGAAEAIDLYGLGCIAIELATGEPPFADADPSRELEGHAHYPPPRIADLRNDLPAELSDLVEWLLAKQPAMRPRSAADVLLQLDAMIERIGSGVRPLRVLIIDDDTARARWLWSLARRAHAAAIVEIASEGTDAAHKLNRDQPDLVFIHAKLRGVMNALELCMYARGIEALARAELVLIGDVSDRDHGLLSGAHVTFLHVDQQLGSAFLDRVRAGVSQRRRTTTTRRMVSG